MLEVIATRHQMGKVTVSLSLSPDPGETCTLGLELPGLTWPGCPPAHLGELDRTGCLHNIFVTYV